MLWRRCSRGGAAGGVQQGRLHRVIGRGRPIVKDSAVVAGANDGAIVEVKRGAFGLKGSVVFIHNGVFKRHLKY